MKKLLTILLVIIALNGFSQNNIIVETNYFNQKSFEVNTDVFFAQTNNSGVGINVGVLKQPNADPSIPITIRGFMETESHIIINLQAGFIAQKKNGAFTKLGVGYSFGAVYALVSWVFIIDKPSWCAGIGVRF